MLRKFINQEMTVGWIEGVIISAIVVACLIATFIIGFRLGTRAGYDSAMTEAVATIDRLPLKEDFNKKSSLEDVTKIYSKLTEDSSVPVEEVSAAVVPEKNATPEIKKFPKLKKGWYVQVHSPSSLIDAEELQKNLKAAGFETYIENSVKDGKPFYRVVAGPESSEIYARRLLDQLLRESLPHKNLFVKEY